MDFEGIVDNENEKEYDK
ncbi:hypothetical protein A2U01_0091413, partial [Trifolium medium]|nr:hypothetical protein [Trifolium medium]